MKAKDYDLILVPSDSFGVPGYFRMAYCIDTEKVERSIAAFEKVRARSLRPLSPVCARWRNSDANKPKGCVSALYMAETHPCPELSRIYVRSVG